MCMLFLHKARLLCQTQFMRIEILIAYVIIPEVISIILPVLEKIFYLPQPESNPGCLIYGQTLYHVAVKAGCVCL